MNLRGASFVATIVLVFAVVGMVLQRALLARGPIGVAFQAIAVVLMIWARVTFGLRSFHAAANPTEGGLVTRGPYQWIRHPIYSAILIFVWAGASSGGSISGIALAALASVAVAFRIAAEERLLVEHYPEYADYAARTKRLIPFVL